MSGSKWANLMGFNDFRQTCFTAADHNLDLADRLTALTEAATAWYQQDGNAVGGIFHVVLDDGNLDHVPWCMTQSCHYPIEDLGDIEAFGRAMLSFPPDVFEEWYEDARYCYGLGVDR